MSRRRRRLHREDIQSLPDRSRASRDSALEVLSLMRREGLSLTRAATRVGTDPRTVRKYVGRALQKTNSGAWEPTKWDRFVRPLRFLTRQGVIELPVQDSRSASKVSAYWKAVKDFLLTGDTEGLRPFENASIQVHGETYEFVTSPRILKRMGNAGQVRFEDLYPITV